MKSPKTTVQLCCLFLTKVFTKQQDFGPVQIQSICRQVNKCNRKVRICFEKGRKHCGKRRKWWLPAFSPFPTMFSKAFSVKIVKSWDSLVKS